VCGGVAFPNSGSSAARKGQSAEHLHAAGKQNPFPYRASHSMLTAFRTLSSRYFMLSSDFGLQTRKINPVNFFWVVRLFCESLLLQRLSVPDSAAKGSLASTHMLTLMFLKPYMKSDKEIVISDANLRQKQDLQSSFSLLPCISVSREAGLWLVGFFFIFCCTLKHGITTVIT